MKTNKTLIFLALAIAALTVPRNAALSTQPKQQRPNILFAIADDWGYGHASAYGSKWVATPGFDRVAPGASRFSSSPETCCKRSAFLVYLFDGG